MTLDPLEQIQRILEPQLAAIRREIGGVRSELGEVKELAQETNGRLRKTEIWIAEAKGKFAVISASARISFTSLIAPILSGGVVAVITALLTVAIAT